MDSETTTTQAPATEPASSTAAETPAVAAPATTEAASPAPVNPVQDESAAENAWFAKQDGAAPAAEPDPVAKDAETPPAASDNAAPVKQATTPQGFDAQTLTILKRANVDPEDFAAMPERSRLKFITTQAKIQSDLDRIFQSRQPATPQGQQPPAQQGQQGQPPAQQQQPAPLDAHWLKLAQTYGEEYANDFRQAIDANNQAILQENQHLRQRSDAITRRLLEDDFNAGLKEASLPKGIDITNEEVRGKILQQAALLCQAEGLDPLTALRRVTPKAAASLYASEILAAQQQQKVATQQRDLKGSFTRTSVIPKAKTEVPTNEEEREAGWFKEHKDLISA